MIIIWNVKIQIYKTMIFMLLYVGMKGGLLP
jgi:hypothetical protein